MISEVYARKAEFVKLQSVLNALKEDWSEVVAHPDQEMEVAFFALEKQVERVIRSCGFILPDSKSDARTSMGDRNTGLEIFYCIPGVLVIISYAFEKVLFSNGDRDTEMRLKDIKAVIV